MGISLEIAQGTARDFQFQLAGATAATEPWTLDPEQTVLITGTPVSTASGSFLSTDVLTASVWAGANDVPLLTPAASWISAANAQVQIAVQNADSLGLAYGVYYLQAFATRAGTPPRTTALLPRGTSLEIIAGPAADTPRPTYITIVNLRRIAPWIDDLQVPDSHEGFDEQCADSPRLARRDDPAELPGRQRLAPRLPRVRPGRLVHRRRPSHLADEPLAVRGAEGQPAPGHAAGPQRVRLLRALPDLRDA